MNRISASLFEQLPLELYTKMTDGVSDSLGIEEVGFHHENIHKKLRSLITLAMVSRRLFTNMMNTLYASPIFRTLVASRQEDRESLSLYQALKPSVDFVKNMSDPKKAVILYGQGNPFFQRKIQHFFDIFRPTTRYNPRDIRQLPTTCNIVECTPRFLFESIMARHLRQSTASVCREQYRSKDKENKLTDYLEAIKTISTSTVQDAATRKKIVKAIRYCPEQLLTISPDSISTDAEYSFEYHAAIDEIENFLGIFGDKREDRRIAWKAVCHDGALLCHFPRFQNDPQIVLKAVQNNIEALQFAHEERKRDRDIVLAAIQYYGRALQFAYKELKKDRDIVRTAVQNHGIALQYAHEELKKDKDIVLAAVQKNGMALQYAHEDLKQDKEIVLAAVQHAGSALQYAHEDFKKDRDIVLAAVQKNGMALRYAHEDFKKDRDIVLAAVHSRWPVLPYAHADFKKDKEIVLAAVQYDWEALQFAHDDLKKDKEFVLTIVQKSGMALQYVHDDLKKDKELVLAAVQNHGKAIFYAHDDLKRDETIALTAIKENPAILQNGLVEGNLIAPELKNNREFILKAMMESHFVFYGLTEEMKKDPEIIEIFNKNRKVWERAIS